MGGREKIVFFLVVMWIVFNFLIYFLVLIGLYFKILFIYKEKIIKIIFYLLNFLISFLINIVYIVYDREYNVILKELRWILLL